MAPIALDTPVIDAHPVNKLPKGITPYSQTPETTADVDWAELVNLDLSKFDLPGGKEALAQQLKYAVHNVGFFYVSDFGISQEEVDYQFHLSQEFFSLPLEEKLKYAANHKAASYNGYNGPHVYEADKTEHHPRHNIEVYNIPKFTPDFPAKETHPQLIQTNWDTIESFAKRVHTNVVERLMKIFAIVLELEDEDYFAKKHDYEKKGEDHMRYMLYHSRSDEVNKEAKELYSTGHTDLGSITLLFRQPVAGLQILSKDGKYKWVKAVPGTITVNIADTLSLLSGHYFKSSIHRVSVPPPDQRHFDRHGILFFIRPNNDVLVEVVKNSPLLKREGVYETLEEREDPLDVATWVHERQKHIFASGYKIVTPGEGQDGDERSNLEAVIAGVKVKYWN
ncbi:hypothetical protein CI109_106760 [Kwoniella shandongensis]|uniref:Uncharacterized protein n=1 Tax=Kwoniella shandongensis TaxID=1734106 RepID=A0A5M6C6Z5_9TREE|nr:uncharacterized protein CI109_000983 [Kwoniella shandongensis]KAA5530803.1 hypothetical protein CI109_000983 [Kwoniella shandongensis]